MAHLEFFPPEILALQHEMLYHPDVIMEMEKCSSKYFEDRLAHLCTHLGVEIDGDFDVDEICMICQKLTDRLFERRTGIVITHRAAQD